MSGKMKKKRLIAAVLCLAMTGSVLAYLPKEVSAQTSTELVNGNFEVGYDGLDVYGWHLTAMADQLSDGMQTDDNAIIQSQEAYTLKTKAVADDDRRLVAALTKYGKGSVAVTSQEFELIGNTSYTISYDAKSDSDWTSADTEIQVAVNQMDSSGNTVAWTVPTTDSTNGGDMTTDDAGTTLTSSWASIARTFTTNENVAKAELYIWVGADDNATGTILLDKVAISTSSSGETENTSEDSLSFMLDGGNATGDTTSTTDICDVIRMKKYIADEDYEINDSADMNANEFINEDDLTLLRWKLLGVKTATAAAEVGIRTDLSIALSEQADALIHSVYELPAVDNLAGYDGSMIENAKLELAKMDDTVKVKVRNRKTLNVLEDAYSDTYTMIYSMTDVSGFSVNENYLNGDASRVTLSSDTDANYGKVLNATFSHNTGVDNDLVIKYAIADDLKTQLSNYDNVCFYVYNGYNGNVTRGFKCNFGGSANDKYVVLNQNEWTKLEVPVDDFVAGNYFGIQSVGWGSGAQTFLFSSFWAEVDTLGNEAQPVINMIDKLPSANELEGYQEAEIKSARAAYDALSDGAKAKVTNYETLIALESAYATNYKMLYDMTDISDFSVNQEYISNADAVTLNSGTDTVYGNILNATYAWSVDGECHLCIEYTTTDDLVTQLAGCDTVCFYVYNDYTSSRDFSFSTTSSVYAKLPAKAWTKIEIPADEFVSGTYFFIWSVGYGSGTAYNYKFSPIWGETYAKSAQSVIRQIDALPSANELEGYQEAEIKSARAAYDALSDGAKAKVTNYETLIALESAYAANYKMVYDMTDVSVFTKKTGYLPSADAVTLNTGTDAAYGNTLKATYKWSGGSQYHLFISYTKPTDLAEQLTGYDTVCFYVYHDYKSDRDFYFNSTSVVHTKLLTNSWTKIEIPVKEFVDGEYFGIMWLNADSTEYNFKFSPIWAESYAKSAQSVIDMIDALPTIAELEGYHQAEITEVRVAYDELSDGAKEKVSNYATLEALESAYASNYKMLYNMSDISAFTKHTGYGASPYFELTAGTDATYGNVLNATYTSDSTGDARHLVIKYTKPTDLETQLSGYDKVCFYVYNGRPDERKIICDFGGSISQSYKALTAGTWTKVEVPVADFIDGSCFGINEIGYKTGTYEFKFSPIWAEKAQ